MSIAYLAFGFIPVIFGWGLVYLWREPRLLIFAAFALPLAVLLGLAGRVTGLVVRGLDPQIVMTAFIVVGGAIVLIRGLWLRAQADADSQRLERDLAEIRSRASH